MARSIWKGPYLSSQLYSHTNNKPVLKDEFNNEDSTIYIHSRSSTITPDFLNKTVHVHNGKEFKPVLINSNHIGHKFGEFSLTKIPAVYKRNKKVSRR